MAFVLLGCGASPLEQVALTSNLDELRSAVADARGRGAIDADVARGLARAVMHRELASRRDSRLADRSLFVRGCRRSLADALFAVAEGTDEPAAEAAVILLDAGMVRPYERIRLGARSHAMVRARLAVGAFAGPRRRQAFLHGDFRVRRAALSAAIESVDAGDVPALFEAARLDPDRRSRTLAVEALGRLGGREVVLLLADLWTRADADLRDSIVDAWSTRPSLRAGGAERLSIVAESSQGVASVSAAVAMLRHGLGPSPFAEGVVVRAIRGDSAGERLRALRDAPYTATLAPVIDAATRSAHLQTQLMAIARVSREGVLDASSLSVLAALAKQGTGPGAVVALSILAERGDASAASALADDLRSARADERALAALTLIELGDFSLGASALADDSPSVRQRVACRLLAPADATAGEPRVEAPLASLLASPRGEGSGP